MHLHLFIYSFIYLHTYLFFCLFFLGLQRHLLPYISHPYFEVWIKFVGLLEANVVQMTLTDITFAYCVGMHDT